MKEDLIKQKEIILKARHAFKNNKQVSSENMLNFNNLIKNFKYPLCIYSQRKNYSNSKTQSELFLKRKSEIKILSNEFSKHLVHIVKYNPLLSRSSKIIKQKSEKINNQSNILLDFNIINNQYYKIG